VPVASSSCAARVSHDPLVANVEPCTPTVQAATVEPPMNPSIILRDIGCAFFIVRLLW